MSKAEGLPISAIIIGTLALAIIVTLVLLQQGYLGRAGDYILGPLEATCEKAEGKVKGECEDNERVLDAYFSDVAVGEKCCVEA